MKIITRDDIGPNVVEVRWDNGDRSYGRGLLYPVRAWVRRVRRRRKLWWFRWAK